MMRPVPGSGSGGAVSAKTAGIRRFEIGTLLGFLAGVVGAVPSLLLCCSCNAPGRRWPRSIERWPRP